MGNFDLNRKLPPCRKTKQRKFVDSGIVKTCDELHPVDGDVAAVADVDS